MKSLILLLGLLSLQAWSCSPACHWDCETPHCPAVCKPNCLAADCRTTCLQPGISECDIKCIPPVCDIRCPETNCTGNDCPPCIIECDEPDCVTHCKAPEPDCHVLCEDPQCVWNCVRPNDCPPPVCHLECDAPECLPHFECCKCNAGNAVRAGRIAEEDYADSEPDFFQRMMFKDTEIDKTCCACSKPETRGIELKKTLKGSEPYKHYLDQRKVKNNLKRFGVPHIAEIDLRAMQKRAKKLSKKNAAYASLLPEFDQINSEKELDQLVQASMDESEFTQHEVMSRLDLDEASLPMIEGKHHTLKQVLDRYPVKSVQRLVNNNLLARDDVGYMNGESMNEVDRKKLEVRVGENRNALNVDPNRGEDDEEDAAED